MTALAAYGASRATGVMRFMTTRPVLVSMHVMTLNLLKYVFFLPLVYDSLCCWYDRFINTVSLHSIYFGVFATQSGLVCSVQLNNGSHIGSCGTDGRYTRGEGGREREREREMVSNVIVDRTIGGSCCHVHSCSGGRTQSNSCNSTQREVPSHERSTLHWPGRGTRGLHR